MQLKNKKSISIANRLAVAAAALVGSNAATNANAQSASAEEEWDFASTVLAYSEPDRVSAVEAIVTAEKEFHDTGKLKYKVVLDTLTGASANGAIAQRNIQTFTRPSGKGSYQISAYETPLDDTFRDTRAQLNINWSDDWQHDWRYTLSTNLSREYDYHSIALSGELAKSFNQKNSTLSMGVSFASDSVKPEGGRPLALSSMVINDGQFADQDSYWQAFDQTRIDGDGSLDTSELLLSWTQTINRRMLAQFSYSYASINGYLTDPFKVVSIVDSLGKTQDVIYESRPDTRKQHSLFGLFKVHLVDSVLDTSYRYFTDDWDVNSHTLDVKWHMFSDKNSYWEPHLRFYQQSSADFYQPYLMEQPTEGSFVSADYRLSDMTAMTVGLKYGFSLSGGNRAEIKAEYYQQSPKSNGKEGDAMVDDLELYPKVGAAILQFTYFF